MAELTVIFTLLSVVWIFTVPLYAQKLVSNATVPRASNSTIGPPARSTSANGAINLDVGKLMKHGYNASYGDTKIVGGHNAFVGECPYQVWRSSSKLLRERAKSFGSPKESDIMTRVCLFELVQVSLRRRVGNERFYGHFCGGSIISKRNVLTAAHCLIGEDIRNIYVTVGSNNLLFMPQNRSVIKWIIHGAYNKDKMENDIAIVEVDNYFQFYNLVSAIPIAPTQKLKTGTECQVSGWGLQNETLHTIPPYLQVVSIPLYDSEACALRYTGTYTLPGMICAGQVMGGQGPCKGDSGGPMVCNGYLTGIVSWGRGCATAYNPSVFTDVAYFASFIKTYTPDVEFGTVAPESASPSFHNFRATWLNIIIIITVFLYYFK